NHRHGHPPYDAALVHSPPRCAGICVPPTLPRAGGDEFALILMNCSGGHACLLLERLQQGLAGSLPVSAGWRQSRCDFAGVAELHAAESLGQVLSVPMPPYSMQSARARDGSPDSPTGAVRAGGQRRARATDGPLQRAFPSPSMNGKATGSRILGRMSDQMLASLDTTRLTRIKPSLLVAHGRSLLPLATRPLH
ncbi:MAG: GGDEF domain-containing protein, partial [Dechloromonas sp.]|nr:GGDEF domain-containing protein [Candidatus Dechloromonas phosphorivorans]